MKAANPASAAHDKSTQAVIDEAAEWVVRMSATDVCLEDKQDFIRWLKRSPVHLGEYLRIERTWADLRALDSDQRLDVTELLACDANVVELKPASAARIEPKTVRPRASGIIAALAASIVLALIGVTWFQMEFAHRYSTGVGEQRTVKLEDGSTVVLNTDTKVRIDFTTGLREVRLLEGEALFNVAKDAARPFRVISDRAVVQAVGTSFIVRQKPDQTVVTVIEGRVAVEHSTQESGTTQPPSQPIQLDAGARADVADHAISTAMIANTAAVTAWRSGRLIFEGETLAEAVAEFNRYNDVQIILDDPNLSAERLSGVFDADQPQALVRFLERSGVVEPAREAGRNIILVPRR